MLVAERLKPRGRRGILGAAALCVALLPATARGAITITAPALPVPYSASAQSGTFEVWVQSTASPQPQVGNFGVEIQLPSFSAVTFVGGPPTTTNTTPTVHPYLYSGQAPTESVVNSFRTVRGTDFAESTVPTLSDGAGLLLVTYSVPAGVSGFYPLTFLDFSNQDQFGTALFDQTSVRIPTTDLNGSITIIPPTAYWRGTTDGVWTTDNLQTGVTNWTIDAAGITDTHIAPGASTDVFFVGSGAANLNTTLGANFTIKGLTFTSTATNPVTIGGNTLTLGADGLTVQAGSAAHTINSAVTITGSQTWQIANGAALPLTVGGMLTVPASATLTKADGGTLVIASAPSLGNNSSLAINGGTMKFAATNGSATVGTAITATVAAGATLELAGTVSALSSNATATARVNIVNNSTANGLVVSGTNQQVGAISGSGNLTIEAGSDLTVNSVQQAALVIGGTSTSPGTVTIRPSDSSGNPLVGNLVSSIGVQQPFAAGLTDNDAASNLSAEPLASHAQASSLLVSGALDGGIQSSGTESVPEPSTVLLALVAALTFFSSLRRTRARANRGRPMLP
jgi:hypothetical protein